MQTAPWNRVISPDSIPQTGAVFMLRADEAVRASISRESGLLEMPHLDATFEVERRGKAGLRVIGRVTATVVQACVVTLEPVTSEVDEEIDLVFLPESEHDVASPVNIEIAADRADNAPEILVGGALDLGALATEFLVLGIDPYPRKAGIEFESPTLSQAEHGPFAALAALKGKRSSTS
jgi:hypothetical protein